METRIEELARIARKNIKKAEGAGYGMFNFDISLSEKGLPQGWKKYKFQPIFQIYPYEGKPCYGDIYILFYTEENGIGDNEAIAWEDLDSVEKNYIYKIFKNQIGGEEKINLSDFVKKDITFEEKIAIVDAWEEDRGSDGEYVYDLDNNEDANAWIVLYGVKVLYECRKEGRFWMGGWQYNCKGENKPRENDMSRGKYPAWCINENNIDKLLNDVVYDDVEDLFLVYVENGTNATIPHYAKAYKGLIDFQSFLTKKNGKFMWVACSNDNSYNEWSGCAFDSAKSCYESMRNAVLEKMKWNTEYDEDFESDDVSIGYEVRFSQTEIVHESFSGKYLYRIYPYNPENVREHQNEMVKELNTTK